MLTQKTLAAPQYPNFIPEIPETDDIREENIRLRKRINQLVRELYDFQKAIREHLDGLNKPNVLNITQTRFDDCGTSALTLYEGNTATWSQRVSSDNIEYYANVGTPGVKFTITVAGRIIIPNDSFRVATAKTPASATASGTTGDICWDSSYIYVAVGTDTWKRAAIATWP